MSWNNLADVDLHVVDPNNEEIYWSHKNSASGGVLDFDNRNGYGPENIYWPAGKSPAGAYKVYVNFYARSTSGALNTSSDYTALITAFGNTKIYKGTVTLTGPKVLVATINSSGVIAQGSQLSMDIYDRTAVESKD